MTVAALTERERVAARSVGPGAPPAPGVWSWLTTVDHKRIGILYGVAAFAFFLLGGFEALLLRLQLAQPNGHVVGAQTFNALFTMHGTTMIFLAVMPASNAFFNYLIPLMIGARDVAFPRLNALSFWIFLFGGLFLNAAWLAGAPPDAGVRVDGAGRAVPQHPRLSDGHGGLDPPDVRPLLRRPLLRRRRRRRPPHVAASVLDLRPPRGVHPDPARDGHRV